MNTDRMKHPALGHYKSSFPRQSVNSETGDLVPRTWFTGAIQILVSTALMLLASGGCASFRGGELAPLAHDQIRIPEPKASADYELKLSSLGVQNVYLLKQFQTEVRKVFDGSGAFSKFSPGAQSAPVHVSIELRNEGNLASAWLMGFLSGLTLTIVPAYARDDYVLVAAVSRNTQVVKRYEYRDHVTSWIQLFLFPLSSSHGSETVSLEVIDNMLMHLLRDMLEDRVLTLQQ